MKFFWTLKYKLAPEPLRDYTEAATQKLTGDWSPIDSYPDVDFNVRPVGTSADSDWKKTSHMVTGGQREVHFCSPGTSSGKQMKARSTSQPQYRIENTPTTIEVDQILLALKQLATNSNFAKFDNNIKRFSKLAKYLTMTMSTFDGKSENFELFEDLFQTSLKIHNQFTEEKKIIYFLSLMRSDALQTSKNITSLNRENLGEMLSVFRRNYEKPPVNGDG